LPGRTPPRIEPVSRVIAPWQSTADRSSRSRHRDHSVRTSYSIIDRHEDEMVDFAREHEIAFAPFFPLGSAFAGGPTRLARDATIVQVADKHGATTSQIALAWLLARYERMLLIPGTSSVAHLEENMAAIELELDDADLVALDRVEQRNGSTG
jgi:pyridoxine 4-dehydrogenase